MSELKKYGYRFGGIAEWELELMLIKAGGSALVKGKPIGEGLFHHVKEFHRLVWPNKDHHRWSELLIRRFAEKRVVSVLGPASSGKSHEAALWGLTQFFSSPHNTTVLITSTTTDELELRIWGEIKKYWEMARSNVGSKIPGFLIDSKQMITESPASVTRDFRNGIVAIPCVVRGKFKGLGKYIGIKNERVILIADELQLMEEGFIRAISNLAKNRNFQVIGMGNPTDETNPLGKMAEPSEEIGGWEGLPDYDKTHEWPTKFYGGWAIGLLGTDSPNYDHDQSKGRKKFDYLIGERDIIDDAAYYGVNSDQFKTFCLGKLSKLSAGRYVITRSVCKAAKVTDPAQWSGSFTRRIIMGVDPAFSSEDGDRSMAVLLEMGFDLAGTHQLAFFTNPVVLRTTGPFPSTEQNIAVHIAELCATHGVNPEDVFFDATGKGNFAFAMASIVGSKANPLFFGGAATDRPAFTWLDPELHQRVPKKCSEEYSKFVTELWFSSRLAIEGGQIKQMPLSTIAEGCARQWYLVSGKKIEVEPKAMTKRTLGRSPDEYDAFTAALEGARQRGFQIVRSLKHGPMPQALANRTMAALETRLKDLATKKRLNYAA